MSKGFIDISKNRKIKLCCDCIFCGKKYRDINGEIIPEIYSQMLEKTYNEMISYKIPEKRIIEIFMKYKCDCKCHKFEKEEDYIDIINMCRDEDDE